MTDHVDPGGTAVALVMAGWKSDQDAMNNLAADLSGAESFELATITLLAGVMAAAFLGIIADNTSDEHAERLLQSLALLLSVGDARYREDVANREDVATLFDSPPRYRWVLTIVAAMAMSGSLAFVLAQFLGYWAMLISIPAGFLIGRESGRWRIPRQQRPAFFSRFPW